MDAHLIHRYRLPYHPPIFLGLGGRNGYQGSFPTLCKSNVRTPFFAPAKDF